MNTKNDTKRVDSEQWPTNLSTSKDEIDKDGDEEHDGSNEKNSDDGDDHDDHDDDDEVEEESLHPLTYMEAEDDSFSQGFISDPGSIMQRSIRRNHQRRLRSVMRHKILSSPKNSVTYTCPILIHIFALPITSWMIGEPDLSRWWRCELRYAKRTVMATDAASVSAPTGMNSAENASASSRQKIQSVWCRPLLAI